MGCIWCFHPALGDRNVTITSKDLAKIGWTTGCPKCRALEAGDKTKTSRTHSHECRSRARELLADDVVFDRRIREALARRQQGGAPEQQDDHEHGAPAEAALDDEIDIPECSKRAAEDDANVEAPQRRLRTKTSVEPLSGTKRDRAGSSTDVRP